MWLFFVSLPPSQDLAGRLATGFNRLGVGVLVGPQFKINDGNTTESKARIYGTVVWGVTGRNIDAALCGRSFDGPQEDRPQ